MTPTRAFFLASATLVAVMAACTETDSTVSVDPSSSQNPGVHRQYGTPQKVGNGTVRTYVVLDQKNGGAPVEIGVAMSEDALQGLPAPMPGPGMQMNMYILDLPAQNPTPYQFVQFDWNPAGHEPAGVYDQPHFDFHFYRVPKSVRDGIVPSDPNFATKAASYPANQF